MKWRDFVAALSPTEMADLQAMLTERRLRAELQPLSEAEKLIPRRLDKIKAYRNRVGCCFGQAIAAVKLYEQGLTS